MAKAGTLYQNAPPPIYSLCDKEEPLATAHVALRVMSQAKKEVLEKLSPCHILVLGMIFF